MKQQKQQQQRRHNDDNHGHNDDDDAITSRAAEDDNGATSTIQTLAEASGFRSQTTISHSGTTSVSSEAWRRLPDSLASSSDLNTIPSGTSVSSEAMEAAARMESVRTTPGAYHVQPLVAEEEHSAAARLSLETEIEETPPRTELRRSSNDVPEDSDADSGGPGVSNAVIDADVEAVAVPIDEAVATLHAIPVVDALTASRIVADEEGEEPSLQQLESQRSAPLEEPDPVRRVSSLTSARFDPPSMSSSAPTPGLNDTISEKEVVSMKKKYMYVICGLTSLLLVALGLGLGLSGRPSNTAGNGQGTDQDSTYRLVDISPQIESSSEGNTAPSVSLGIRLPTAVQGTFNRSLFVGWDKKGGIVKVYESQMKRSRDGSVSVGPFAESMSIPLADASGGNTSEPPGDMGSAIIVDAGAGGQTFVVSHRNRVRLYSNLLHEAIRLCCQADMVSSGLNRFVLDQADIDEAAKTLLAAAPGSFLGSASTTAVNISDASSMSDLATSNLLTWSQRGSSLSGDDDPVIQGFGNSIGFSPVGPNLMGRLVVRSDSGHVRVYRLKRTNGPLADWERLDGGLLDPGPDSNIGKAVIALAGGGNRFAVGYPSLGKVSLYQFIDEKTIDERRLNIELVDEIYSEENDDDDMFGQSLSLDILGNFLVMGAKGYARAFWLRMLPSAAEYVPAGDKIIGEESEGFGSVVASGRVPHHSGCAGCPFDLDEQRIAISSPAYDNGRGRVLLYQYKEDEEVWQPLASPIEGEVEGEGMGHDVRISPDMSAVVTSSSSGEVRTFRLQPVQQDQ